MNQNLNRNEFIFPNSIATPTELLLKSEVTPTLPLPENDPKIDPNTTPKNENSNSDVTLT